MTKTQFPAWQPIESVPYQKIVWVKNDHIEEPVRATRGYTHNGMVHPNSLFFTSVFTLNDLMPFPPGKLVCPTEWRPEPPT